MNRLISALFLFAGFFAVAAIAQEKPSDLRIFISDVTVINTDTGKEVRHRTVIVSGERIAEVKDSRVEPPTGAKIVDGTGKYLIPGFCLFGPALKVEDWYARSGETPHLCLSFVPVEEPDA